MVKEKLKEGKSKKIALICLQRRLVDIIYAMMRDRSAYKLPENVGVEYTSAAISDSILHPPSYLIY